MSKKKAAKKLRKALAEQFDDWLDSLDAEQLAAVRVSAKHVKPSFRAVLEKKADTLGEMAS